MEQYTINIETNVALPIVITSDEAFLPEHYSMFRIIFIEEGTGIININEKSTVFMAPSIFCLNENEIVALEKECKLKVQAIFFKPQIINSILTIDNIKKSLETLTMSEIQDYFYILPFICRVNNFTGNFEIGTVMAKKISHLFELLKAEIIRIDNLYWACRTRSFFLEILFLIQYSYTDSKVESNMQLSYKSSDINDIILYLHTNYDKKITIKQLTDIFHINRTTLSNNFSHATGMSIIDYLVKLRIKVASMLLRDTHLTISEVAYKSGFNNNTYFLRTYRNYVGCTPSEYRKKADSLT
ncbi:MAG: helix-turn-helix transcriptional regulator [Clostridium sp.]|uniref:helix-turn-helix transcriptional regulator n=1 Tax=Clostridium sp. TaxID=1506 RepID=UPI003D6CB621